MDTASPVDNAARQGVGSRSRRHPARAALTTVALATRVASAVKPVPLLAVRIPEFERIAWRDGKPAALRAERAAARALRRAAVRVLRSADLLAHDPGTDVFAVAMLASPRDARTPTALDCRAALERLASAVRTDARLAVDSGWIVVKQLFGEASLAHEIEQALERGARERERYEFFAAVGHELRTPLTSIRGYLETLIGEDLDAPTQRRFLETACREALRLGRLVDGMLDFSLLDLSSDAAIPASCDLAEQMAAACDASALQAAQRGIAIERGQWDAVRVGLGADGCVQALINVIENAVKHGNPIGRVRVESALDPPYACVRVDDDGPGITSAERRTVFAARVRGSAARGPGQGLGLAIVKTIVERAGGDVRVDRSPLGGARFELRLPMRSDVPETAVL